MAEDCSKTHGLPSHTALYLQPSYWNERFAGEEHYEWFKNYSHFRHLVLSHIKVTDRINLTDDQHRKEHVQLIIECCIATSKVLEVGCGNSQMGEEMFKDGITQITCTDLSPVAIKLLQERSVAKGLEGIEYRVADMLDLPFEDSSFDIVIEKGAVDCLFVDSGDPWNPKLEVAQRVLKMLKEIHRVLTPTGMFISIAFGQPHFRRPFFEAEGLTWSTKWDTFGDSFHYFFYTLEKGTKSSKENVNDSLPTEEKVVFDLEHEFMENEDYLLHSRLGEDQ